MSAIDKIYANDFGISFYWRKKDKDTKDKIQLIFRDTGFLLTVNELKDFAKSCAYTMTSIQCSNCQHIDTCRSLLLRTPSEKIDLAVNRTELYQINELIKGTIFNVELKYWLNNLCAN
ncbi:hypothetical protein [Aquimarina rhabdastrellae]